MFKLYCPKCGSSRIHRGYSPAPFYKRLFLFQNLLCNGCNLLFTGFVWPGTVEQQSRRKRKPRNSVVENSPQLQKTQSTLQSARAAVISGTAAEGKAPVLPVSETEPKSAEAVSWQPVIVPAPPEAARITSFTAHRAVLSPVPTVAETVIDADAGEAEDFPFAVHPPAPPPALTVVSEAHDAQVNPETTPVSIRKAEGIAIAPTANPARRQRKKTSSGTTSESRRPGLFDYARFGVYYAGLYAKTKIGIRDASHSLELKFRWRNWWHWQRAKES